MCAGVLNARKIIESVSYMYIHLIQYDQYLYTVSFFVSHCLIQ